MAQVFVQLGYKSFGLLTLVIRSAFGYERTL